MIHVAPVQRLKLRTPEVSAAVPQRLLAPVLDAPGGSTTVLVAAPGYGRTTVAAAAARRRSGAWVSCDGFDRRPGRLWQHVEAAVASSNGVPIGRTVHHDVVAHLDALLDRWSEGPCHLIVLDDVHLALDHGVADQLAYLAAHLPDQVRLVLTSRRDLGGLLTAMPSAHGIGILTEDHLALTRDEAAALLADAGPAAHESGLDHLLDLCDGWVAALRRAVAPGRATAAEGIAALTGVGGEDLLEPWWSQLRGRLREALVATLEAGVLTPAVCDLLLGRDDGATVVRALVAEHCYLRATCPAPGLVGYRRHPLLTAFLRHRQGAAQVPPDRHRAVATWAQTHGAADLVVRHLVSAGDTEAAVATVHRYEERMLHERRTDEVLAWYRLLPDDAVGSQAELVLRRGWGELLSGRVAQADREHRWLAAMLGATAPDDPPLRAMRAECAALGATLAAYRADPATMLAESLTATALFGDAWDRPVHEAMAVMAARALLWLGRSADAHELVDRLRLRPGVSRLTRDVLVTGVAAATALARGEVRQGLSLAERALAALAPADVGVSPLGEGAARVVQALAHLELAEIDIAERELQACAAAARKADDLGLEAIGLGGLARAAAARGDLSTAIERHDDTVAMLRRRMPGSGLLPGLHSTGAALRLRAGDAARASRLISGLHPGASTTLLQVRLSQLRRPGAGLSRLARLQTPDPRHEVERLVLLGCASATQHPARAAGHLTAAAELAEALGLRLALVGLTPRELDMAAVAAIRTGDPALGQLVDIARHAAAHRRAEPPAHRGAALPPLSPGERQLLVLLPSRESNATLAASLSVSVNTLKTRLRRLYAKLGVHTRDEAIRAARSRGLLG